MAEIEISDDTRSGAGPSGGTWKATCRGRTFFCTEGRSEASKNSGYVQGQVTCTEELAAIPTGGEQGRARKRDFSEANIPKKALGFQFWTTLAETEQACLQAGHTFGLESDRHVCSGTPRNIGVAARSELRFCGGKLCDLTVFVRVSPGSDGEEQFKQLWRSLTNQYDQPTIRKEQVPKPCEGKLMGCIARGAGSLQAGWEWKTGERIILKALSVDESTEIAVRYVLGEADPLTPPADGKLDGTAF